MSATLRAEFYFDDEARNWHYRVPALHINGGGAASREDAERDCLDAISFALQGDPNDYDSDAVTLVVASQWRPGGDRAVEWAPGPGQTTPMYAK